MVELYKNILTEEVLTKEQLGQVLRSEIAYNLFVVNGMEEDHEGVLNLNDDELILGTDLYEKI